MKQLLFVFLLTATTAASAQSSTTAPVSRGRVLLDTTLNGSGNVEKTSRDYYNLTEAVIKKISDVNRWDIDREVICYFEKLEK